MTLKDFITDQKDLLSALSVFAGLTLFSRDLISGILGEIIAILFLAGFILLWLEIWSNFPKNGSVRLAWFEETIILTGIMVIIYWFSKLKFFSTDVFIIYLTLPIVYFVMYLVSRVIKKNDVFNRIFHAREGEKKNLRYIFGIVLVSVVFIFVHFCVSWFVKKNEAKINKVVKLLISTPQEK